MSETTDAPFVVTLKGGKGYEAPWIVVRGDTVDEITDNLSALADSAVYGLVADAASLFQGSVTVVTPSGRAPAPTPGGSGEPAQEAQAEAAAPARQRGNGGQSSYARKKSSASSGGRGGKRPYISYEEASADCDHGERVRRSGQSAKGPWVGYFCSLDKSDPNNCGPKFLSNPDEDMEN